MAYAGGSPAAGQLEVGIALVLRDRFSNQAREASAEIRRLHNDAKNAIAANAQAATGIAYRTGAVAGLMGAGLRSAILEGAGFIDMMTSVRVISAATDDQLRGLSNTAQTLGLQTMFHSTDIASGLKYLAMAGVEAKDLSEIITGAAYAAGATGLELGGKGGAADMITNIMRVFKIEAAEAASVVGDQLTKATLSSNISMTDLAESIRYAAADMVNLKQQLPQVAAMIGTLGNAGIQGSMAGTALSNMARYLNKSIVDTNYKGAKRLATLGLSKQDFVDAKGDLVDFSIILEKIQKATSSLSSTDRSAVMLDIFGVRGNRAAMALMNNIQGYRDLLNKVTFESEGFAKEVVSERMETIAGAINILTSAWQNFKTTFTEAVAPILTPLIRGLGKVVSIMRNMMAIPVLGNIIAALMVATPLVLGLGSAFVILRSRWLLLRNDSMVTGRSMFSLLTGGWRIASIEARRYQMIEATILAQRKAGIMGMPGAAMMQSGFPVGGVTYVGGRFRNAKTGRFVSNAAGRTAAQSATAGTLARTAVGGAAAGAAVKTGSRAIIGSLGRILGFMTGPWGMAIMAATSGIVYLTKRQQEKNAAQRENTEALNALNRTIREERGILDPGKDNNLIIIEELRLLINAMASFEAARRKEPVAQLTVKVDGRDTILDVLRGANDEINLQMGTN